MQSRGGAAAQARHLAGAARWRMRAAIGGLRAIPVLDDRIHPAARRDLADFDRLRELLAFRLSADDCCIDIGAHTGKVLAEMVRVAPQGRHLAFEPIPGLASHLRTTFPQVEVHQAALSDTSGTAEFAHVLGVAEGWSGLKFRPLPGDEPAEVEPLDVRVEVLDDVLAPDLGPALIKIDVEGAELQVLRGAIRTLERHRPTVVFEHGSGSAELFGTEPRDVFGFFRELNYRLFDLDGNGPYTLAELEDAFRSQTRVNFVATS